MRTVLDDLDHDWQHLRNSQELRIALRRWNLDAHTGNELTASTTESDYNRADDIVHTLLVATHQARLARRVALALLRPSLRATARRCYRLPSDEAAAVVVAAAWEELARYPDRARPRYVIATITRAVRKRVVRRVTRPSPHIHEEIIDLADPADAYERIDIHDQLTRAQRRSGVDHHTMNMIVAHRIHGRPFADIAAETDLAPTTVRQRASRAERELRTVLKPREFGSRV